MNWRIPVVLFSTVLFLMLTGFVFWQQDWQYSLPAVRPAGWRQPAVGERILLPLAGLTLDKSRPLFLHFFNPDCPCSRFNLDHVRQLIRRHRGDVRFIAVLQGEGGSALLRAKFEKLNLGVESVADETGAWAEAAGVYATPQAVVIDRNERLYFRGNYNISRYCVVPGTEYARIALESILAGLPAKPEDPGAAISYGCPRSKIAKGAKQPA
ncbi:MAG: AhpC/TSA family protein [Bryobacterales bacterium]|nr:AhpC/TSA family protein [Bryobacterales bacterium]